VTLEPNRRENRIASSPHAGPSARFKAPTNETVAVGTCDNVELSIAVCKIPQQLIRPLLQNVIMAAENTTVQP